MELISSVLLILATIAFGLAMIGYAARQWRRLRRGE